MKWRRRGRTREPDRLDYQTTPSGATPDRLKSNRPAGGGASGTVQKKGLTYYSTNHEEDEKK